jgi:hypothetical protein
MAENRDCFASLAMTFYRLNFNDPSGFGQTPRITGESMDGIIPRGQMEGPNLFGKAEKKGGYR